MSELKIAATARSPEIDFDFASGTLRMRGESYPDDAAGFFGPVFTALRDHLASDARGDIRFDIELVYFNSSSAKAFMNMFQALESAAADGRRIVVNWHYEAEDETMREFGEDFSEDLKHVVFNLKESG